MTIISIKNLSFTYPGSDKKVLDNINLDVQKGDFIAILGNNGSGKSTFCKCLNGLIPHFIVGYFEGQVLVNDKNTLDMDVGMLAKEVAYVYQDFENQIVRPTVLDDASFACLNYGFENYEDMARQALKSCGLEGKEEDYIWQLSGGQTHLLALAGAIALGPDILILDEPIAQLDPQNADKIYQILDFLRTKHNKTIIAIEHHTEYIAKYCNKLILIKDGKIAWNLPTKEGLSRIDELKESDIFPPQITQVASILNKNKLLETKDYLPINVEEGVKYFSSLKLNDYFHINEPNINENIIEFQDVLLAYESIKGDPKIIFQDFNLSIKRGDKVALIGSNGAGKSTLMKLIVGLLKPAFGQINLLEKNITKVDEEELANHVSLVYQNPEEMFIMDSIEDDIAYAMKERGQDAYREKTLELLKRFRLEDIKDRDGRLLSGGQMRRASVAIGIALKPKVLMLDEPTANLDMATRSEIIKVLEDIKNETETIIVATHDMQLVSQWADRIIVLHQGKVIADKSKDEVFSDPELKELVGIRPPEIFELAQALNPNAHIYTVEDFIKNAEVSHE